MVRKPLTPVRNYVRFPCHVRHNHACHLLCPAPLQETEPMLRRCWGLAILGVFSFALVPAWGLSQSSTPYNEDAVKALSKRIDHIWPRSGRQRSHPGAKAEDHVFSAGSISTSLAASPTCCISTISWTMRTPTSAGSGSIICSTVRSIHAIWPTFGGHHRRLSDQPAVPVRCAAVRKLAARSSRKKMSRSTKRWSSC